MSVGEADGDVSADSQRRPVRRAISRPLPARRQERVCRRWHRWTQIRTWS